jgi:type IV pilus assembly protein PilE
MNEPPCLARFRSRNKANGFTLTELVIVIAIIALLVALAVPSFSAYARKGKRAEAQQLLMNWANNQEIWRANNPTYAGTDDIPAPGHEVYTFTISGVSATSFTLTATATDSQVNDKDKGVSCTPLTLDAAGNRGPAAGCWGR